jgi:hypothetical protein
VPAGTSARAGTPSCSDIETGQADSTATCVANTPLWNARGFAKSFDDNTGTINQAESEAVARCVGATPQFETAATFGALTGGLSNDPTKPNQALDPTGSGFQNGTVTFWETNWDPRTDQTTDGSSTVFVNAIHIITPAENIILGHSEASVECPPPPSPTPSTASPTPTIVPSTPEGGFPRDINLNASKSVVTYGNTFSLAGSITPNSAFETPRYCVEGVNVTIRRDIVGPPQEFEDVGTVQTDQQGNFSFNFAADKNAQWLAFIDKDNPQNCAQSSSNSQPVLIRPFVRLRVSDKTPPRGSNITFHGGVEPCDNHAGTFLKLRRQFAGRAVKVARKIIDGNCLVNFIQHVDFNRAVFDAVWAKQDSDHQTGRSRPKVVLSHKRHRHRR